MENIMLFLKFILFFSMQFSVLLIIGAVLIGGLYQVVRDKVKESRRQDEIQSDASHSTLPHRS